MNNIREFRENKGLTIKNLADIVGVHFTTVSEWELGKITPRSKKRNDIANALGATTEKLFPSIILPKATHQGEIKIGDKELTCAVLEDSTRIITMSAVFKALDRTTRSKINVGNRVINMPSFIDANNLQPFISDDLRGVINLVEYKNTKGQSSSGYDAKILPLVCDSYLAARAEGKLTKKQLPVANNCEVLVRSFAKIGIIALVDEATGYQEIRDKKALQEILDQYLEKEFAVWAKRFPDEFYKEMFRLKGWDWKPMNVKRPGVVGKYTKDIVYERLAPGILKELEERNPKNEKGNRKAKHHQFLTDDVGHPALSQHLYAVIGFMRASSSWDKFKRLLDQAFPKRNTTIEIPFEYDD